MFNLKKLFNKNKQIKKYSWKDVTISMYRKILDLKKDEDYAFNLVAIFEGTTLENILNGDITETLKCTAALNEFISTNPRNLSVKSEYVLNGKTYRISRNPADINTAQYFDFVNTPKELPANLSRILAIFMIPENAESYSTGYDIESAIYDIENYMNVEEALGVCNFFTELFRVYSKVALRKTRKALKAARKAGLPEEQIQEVQDRLEMSSRLIKYYKW